jgi:hypothetical protein
MQIWFMEYFKIPSTIQRFGAYPRFMKWEMKAPPSNEGFVQILNAIFADDVKDKHLVPEDDEALIFESNPK